MNILISAFVGTLLLMAGLLWWQTNRLETAQAELATANGYLSACGGRLQTVLDDVRSDNEIDAIPDSALRDVPAHWLIPDEIDRPSQI